LNNDEEEYCICYTCGTLETNSSLISEEIEGQQVVCPSWPTWGMSFTASTLQIGDYHSYQHTTCCLFVCRGHAQGHFPVEGAVWQLPWTV